LGAGGPRATASARFHGPTEEMGGGEDVLLARPEPPHEQGLRAAAGELGGVRIHCDDAPDGEEVSPLVRLFRRFLTRLCPEDAHSGTMCLGTPTTGNMP
jgi:hypothetical protein